jgi:hypothetical protein
MKKWKAGKLRSGSKKGKTVKSQKQAVAIMLSEKRKEKGGKYVDKAKSKKAKPKKAKKLNMTKPKGKGAKKKKMMNVGMALSK